MFRALSFMVVLMLASPVRADDAEKEKKGPPADELLTEALSKAKKDDKRVFLIFGSPSCGWCKYFAKYHADAEVGKVVGKYFVLVKVDVVTNPGGEEMYQKYGTDRGVPAWTLLTPDTKVLTDSGNGRDNVGFPYEDKEVEHYIKAIRAAAPKMTDAEAALLVKKLHDIGPKKKPEAKKER
jgi:thiol-disulfide isomerase/thioredoxin